MSSLPTDSFKISITTTTTTESNNNIITSQPTSSPEPENANSLGVETPEKITKHASQISSIYTNQELNRSATSLSTVDYIVPSNDPRSSTQIFKLQNIDYSAFSDISPLGDGKSIKIFVSTWKNDKDMSRVALKKVESLVAFSQALKEDPNEASENKSLVDNNILSIFGYSQNPESSDYFMILQYTDGGNLRNYLQEYHSKLSWTDRIRLIINIASGLQYIHNHDIVHLSLYPQNILVHNGQLMISDLGISKSSIPKKSSVIPTLPYIDPNYLASPTTYPREKHLDIYSLARLGRLKLDPVWVDNDEIAGNGGKKKLPTVEYNDDIKGIILESKQAFGTGSVSFSNGNISSIRDVEINENEIYGEEEDIEKGCIRRRHKFGIFICWIVIFCTGAFSIFFFAVIKFATSKS
ncbi:24167_t:CDS:2 [Dentiscutata erythropus]|uniref:24167_t:CDS:1 n=1 Tax=Dentiscutata erythropus TaxID=1348616 RepID=A0A9N8W7B8_9GLOM|nr:24167_t:CDS:2 [Dentiscutata erythropus]